MQEFATFTLGTGNVLAVALHSGHELRPEIARLSALSDAGRLREEDPFTAEWTVCAPTCVVVNRSRFEVDCNRPRDRAVYRVPEHAWDLPLWRDPLPDEWAAVSLGLYDAFYDRLHGVLEGVIARHGAALVLDLHSYNHRRDGAHAPSALQDENPDVNLGTGYLDRARWSAVSAAFTDEFRREMPGVDVRENVKFRGGQLARWAADTFGGDVCVLAIEFKKTFMDEWSGELDPEACSRITTALGVVVPRVEAVFARDVSML